jgi:hypothetical protein
MKRKEPKKPASRARRELGAAEASGRFSDAMKRYKSNRVGPAQLLGKLVDMFAAGVVLAVLTPEEDVRAAGGNLFAAMSGHKCGPDCPHAVGTTPAERQAWWDKRLMEYDERQAALARQTIAPWLQPPPVAVRCGAKCDGKQCCFQAGHALPHRDTPDTSMPQGGRAWWT